MWLFHRKVYSKCTRITNEKVYRAITLLQHPRACKPTVRPYTELLPGSIWCLTVERERERQGGQTICRQPRTVRRQFCVSTSLLETSLRWQIGLIGAVPAKTSVLKRPPRASDNRDDRLSTLAPPGSVEEMRESAHLSWYRRSRRGELDAIAGVLADGGSDFNEPCDFECPDSSVSWGFNCYQ